MKSSEDIYVLGTGLSHEGSACLLKNGKICVAIEKERITRVKRDGNNDTDAIKYCLDAENITIEDVDLVVQNANFSSFKFGNSFFFGDRIFTPDTKVPVVTVSHHLAHAYYAVGTCPFDESAILVIDGCGNSFDDCDDVNHTVTLPQNIPEELKHLYFEKDSYYYYKDNTLLPVFKDFSEAGFTAKGYPMHPGSTMHSIGGLFSAASIYCFNNGNDSGKLMGLAPYGRPGVYDKSIFNFENGRVFVNYDWMIDFKNPIRSFKDFWANFQYYADIAYWVQREAEKALNYVIECRSKLFDCKNLCFSGGVALNAVANGKIANSGLFENYYFTPAAGDNGLAIGCAFYGWLEVLKKKKVKHDGSSCFGKIISNKENCLSALDK